MDKINFTVGEQMKLKIPTRWWQLTENEADSRNPPPLDVIEQEGKVYQEMILNPEWLLMGYIPMPKSRLQRFLHDLYHGYAMRYPWHKVFWYAVHGLITRESVINFEGTLNEALEYNFYCNRVGRAVFIAKRSDGEWEYIGTFERQKNEST